MANFAIKNLNGWNNVEGKIFLGEELGLTGAEASVQRLAAGENPAFLHSPDNHRVMPTCGQTLTFPREEA